MTPGSTHAVCRSGWSSSSRFMYFREVQDDGDVAALARKARAAAPAQHRRAVRAAQFHGCHDVAGVARNDDPDRHLPGHREVGRVERPRAVIEVDLATDPPRQFGGERLGVRVDPGRVDEWSGGDHVWSSSTANDGNGRPRRGRSSTAGRCGPDPVRFSPDSSHVCSAGRRGME
jgi:hypothetical protein